MTFKFTSFQWVYGTNLHRQKVLHELQICTFVYVYGLRLFYITVTLFTTDFVFVVINHSETNDSKLSQPSGPQDK